MVNAYGEAAFLESTQCEWRVPHPSISVSQPYALAFPGRIPPASGVSRQKRP